jgi:uncharacterized repeat protein (TIGR01451 family)
MIGGAMRWTLYSHARRAVTVAAILALLLVGTMGGPARAQTAPANDSVDAATTAGVPDLLVVDTSNATTATDEPVPSCAPPGTAPIRRTVWYTVTPPGAALRVSTAGDSTGFRPILALYQRDATGRLAEVACDDTWGLSATVSGGQAYYLQVGGAGQNGSAEGGQISLVVGPVTGSASGGGSATADLAVTLSDTPDPIAPGADLTYTAAVANNGPDQAVDVTATLTPAGSLRFRSITSPPGWTCSTPAIDGNGSVTCTAGAMAQGQTAQFGVVLRVPPDIGNGATLATTWAASAGSSSDPAGGNNSASAQTTVSTSVPTSCAPRPNVGLQTRQAGPGQIVVTISVAGNPTASTNALQAVRIDAVTNAVIAVPNGPQASGAPVSLPIPAGAQTAGFTLRRTAPGAFRADLTVTDACGPWHTFVGGGVGVP